jgi:hypothetical protein
MVHRHLTALSGLSVLLLVLLCIPEAGAQCPNTQYYTPKYCLDYGIRVEFWECRDCTVGAEQYKYGGVSLDETCMCKPGGYAVNAYTKCYSFKGNADGEPPVDDTFTCGPCSEGTMLCPGGITTVKKDAPSNTAYFTQCSDQDASCASGYSLLPAAGSKSIVSTEKRHMPQMRCLVLGQRSENGINCKCPQNSNVVYRVEHKGLQGSASLNIWNYDVFPTQPDPSDARLKYFGFCRCKPGYYGSNPASHDSGCLPCPKGNYCSEGAKTPCNPGWTTGEGVNAVSAAECKICMSGEIAGCPNGQYCDVDKPNAKDASCLPCPAGKSCSGRMDAPTLCDAGTYSSGSATVCSPCQSGKYNNAKGSSECIDCKAGKYSVASLPGAPIINCEECLKGKYSSKDGASSCVACNAVGVYQSAGGKTTCDKCRPGWGNITSPEKLSPDLGYESEAQVCQQCTAGKYSAEYGASCSECELNSYNALVGQTECTPCAGDLITLSKGAASVLNCKCPADRFHEGSGRCTPCGSCLPNEYVKSPCGSASDVQCEVCQSCSAKDQYVIPGSMCNGKGGLLEAAQACAQCKLATGCSKSINDDFQTLYNCYSGTVSNDTTVCMPAATNPLEVVCGRGEYQVCFVARVRACVLVCAVRLL